MLALKSDLSQYANNCIPASRGKKMILTVNCQHCGKDFESDGMERIEACPHCGQKTRVARGGIGEPAPMATIPPASPKPAEKFVGARFFHPYVALALIIALGAVVCILVALLAASQKANRELQAQLAVAKEAADAAEMKQQLVQDDQAVRDAVAGIYEFKRPDEDITDVLDFRSDGTVVSYYYYSNSDTQSFKRTSTWWTSGRNSISIEGIGAFRPEGNDLIDAKGNRWLRTR